MKATRRKAKPGQVLFLYGRLPKDGPDHLVMYGGGGATKRHSNVVMHGMTSKRIEVTPKSAPGYVWGPSFLEELEAAGFDVTTIQFSIQMKEPTP